MITGGAGAIGNNLVIALDKVLKCKDITVIDDLSSYKLKTPVLIDKNTNVRFIQGDITNEGDIKRAFRNKPDIVFHLAAFFANQNSIEYPFKSINVDIKGTLNILEYSLLSNVEKVVYASSGCAIYGSYPKLPIEEDFISINLTTPYQINKLTGEMYCNYFLNHYDLNITNCRFFNSYGPGEFPGQFRNVIPNMIYWATNGEALPITGKGNETRDFTSVFDLVQGLLKSASNKNSKGKAFNLASSKEVKIIDLANTINDLTSNEGGIEFLNRRKWDTKPRILASIKKAKKIINYSPVINFNEGLLDTINWHKKNINLVREHADFPPGINPSIVDRK